MVRLKLRPRTAHAAEYTGNLAFIRSCAAEYHRAYRNVRLDADDYTQAASLALLRAAERFDPARGIAFQAFAGTVIRNAILDEIRRAYPEKDILSYEEAALGIRTDYPPETWSSYKDNPEYILIMKEQTAELHAAMERLPLRENTWVRCRFGFDADPAPLAQAAQRFHLSVSRAEKLEGRALGKVRRWMRG